MNENLQSLLYLAAAVAFIIGLKRLSSPLTARSGNQIAAGGMLLAVVVTLLDDDIVDFEWIVAGLIVGALIGAGLARRVQMTAMPQLVAVFNGFGGAASALVAAAEFVDNTGLPTDTEISIVFSAAIGSVTFTGSMIAFAKLQGVISGSPATYPGQTVVDAALAVALIGCGAWLVAGGGETALWLLVGASALLGISRVMAIGGGDMPVVIALLNSMSGLAAASAGFVIDSNALIISGALVGASGLILTLIMARAMNRSIPDILFGAFGVGEGAAPTAADDRPVRSATPEDVAIALAYADSVIIIPGYGLAVAQAQHALKDLVNLLDDKGVTVRYAIHPVAGRMPGHMNVLLAEADVPYEQLYDLADINADFSSTDVALVVGANDVVNPLARDESSPIAGMPILDADRSRTCVVVKRSLSPGFAGIDNPLFYTENTQMLFSDAKAAMEDLAVAVRDL